MTVCERIDAILQKKNMSRRQLAIKAEIAPSSLQSAMQRNTTLSLDMLHPISHVLGVDPLYLQTGKREEELHKELEEDLKAFEAENKERLLATFAIRHPRFMEALSAVGISIRLTEKEMWADWEGMSVELTMDDIEELHDKLQRDFLYSIQNLLSIPVYDEYKKHTEAPSETLEDDE